ncbi:MAG TPA: hypothetical protein VKE70_14550 [Candidatus Solibacter sp.]|nr:hypothetical protein [Candidatus Solibacter sp.]
MELFEQIRREYEFGTGTIAGVAKKLGVNRRMVREAIGSALPKPRKKTERPRWKLRAAMDFVDAVLEADRKAPRKQRHHVSGEDVLRSRGFDVTGRQLSLGYTARCAHSQVPFGAYG